MPYTHSMGEIRSFTIAVVEGNTFLITAGGEGAIRTWKFDPATSKFDQLAVLEGHVRSITSLILHGKTSFY